MYMYRRAARARNVLSTSKHESASRAGTMAGNGFVIPACSNWSRKTIRRTIAA
jgi:hypothetical protein